MHNFAGWVTPKTDFKVKIFFNIKYLEIDKRNKSYSYNVINVDKV